MWITICSLRYGLCNPKAVDKQRYICKKKQKKKDVLSKMKILFFHYGNIIFIIIMLYFMYSSYNTLIKVTIVVWKHFCK